MAKEFAARVSKKERKVIDLPENLASRNLFESSDSKLLRGAKLGDIALKDIEVRKQVRTKFNDDSLRELSENIRVNGLIQPLVIHREGNKFVLICGERRFRAMTLINTEKAPCYILENKSPEELMAIQFSENSAREELHYIDQADSIAGYKKVTDFSERKITEALGISKSEVHRALIISKLPKDMKEAAKMYNVEKYVLLEWDQLEACSEKDALRKQIVKGEITKRVELSRALKGVGPVKVKKATLPSSHQLLQLVKAKQKEGDLDADTLKLLKQLMAEAQDLNTGI